MDEKLDVDELKKNGLISDEEKQEVINLVKNGVRIYPSEETLFATLVMGRMPASKAIEWEKDCKDNFEGKRWVKAWHDHKYTHSDEKTKVIIELLEQLESQIASLKLKTEELEAKMKQGLQEKSEVRTLGAEGIVIG